MVKGIFELEDAKAVIFEPEETNNYLIVDGLNLAFRYKHAKASNFAESYLKTINSFAKSYGANTVIVLSDWGSSTYRKEIYPEYKADRKEKIAQQTEEENQLFLDFIDEFNRALELCSVQHIVFKYQGVEADDIAAYLCEQIYPTLNENKIWLISSDKDWDMLINEKICRFSYVTRKEYTYANWNDHYDFSHDILLDIKVLQGGKDNVKGVNGIGIKRAETIIKKYGAVQDLKLPLPGTAQYIKNLNEAGHELISRNLKLIDKRTHCQQAIGDENLKDIDTRLNEYVFNSSIG